MLSLQFNTNVPEPIIRVSPSRLRTYQECPKLFDFVYRQGFKRKESKQYFDLGNYIHELLHVYYQTLEVSPGVDRDFLSASLQSRIRNDLASARPEHIQIYNKARKHITRFIQLQSKKIDRGIKVQNVEYEYDIPVTLPSGRIVHLYGFIDLVYRTLRGQLVVRDHKSTTSPKNFTDNNTKSDLQLLMYGAAIWLLTKEAPAVEFNILNTYEYKGAPNLENEFKVITVHHKDKVYENFLVETLDLIDQMLDSKPTPHYSRNCSSCAFDDVCTMQLKGSSVVRLIEANYERIDPNQPKRSFTDTENDTSQNGSS